MSPVSQSTIKDAVEYHAITSRKGILERLFTLWFDGFVYNQIWEDPRVDAEALQLDDNSRILTIASGGCNILNYLMHSPHEIRAVDLNQYHIYFTLLKLTALRHLPTYEDFFDFYGHANKQKNLDNYYKYIQPNLEENAREFWESGSLFTGKRIEYFTKNIYRYGTMGYFIRFVHTLARWFARNPNDLLNTHTMQEQEEFFEKHYAPFFNNRLVKFLSSMPILLYSLGIPPQQFRYIKEECDGRLSELLRERVKRIACGFPIEDNYYAWQAFGLRYDTVNRQAVPEYLKKEHYETIKNNLDRVKLEYTSTTQFLKEHADDSLNCFIFLDSMDWMDKQSITELWTEIARVGMPGSRVIFRTASWESPIETALPPELRSKFNYEEERSKEGHKNDRSAIYGGFHIYQMPA